VVSDEAGGAILYYNYLCGMNFYGLLVLEPHHDDVGSTGPETDAPDL
jgi:hypothetical protein